MKTGDPSGVAGLFAELATALPADRAEDELALIERAFRFAENRHENQTRDSGEPYLVHPAGVALIVIRMQLDGACIAAALLHDTVEDTETSLSEITTLFGEEIAALVDGLTKISGLHSNLSSNLQSAENLRKMFFAMARDIRVIFIKLADRLHNMRTLGHKEGERRKAIARETLEIYAPLAARLGIGWLRNELEDLSLKYLDPDAYYELKQKVESTRTGRLAYVERVIAALRGDLEPHGLSVDIIGRAKHFYSIYRKMREKGKTFDEVMDLTAIRILTRTVPDCYQVLGLIHSLYRPLYHRFKDYIALPKSNMYSSLHTTVIGPEGRLLEVQIRTREMDALAEEGAASHLFYKEGGPAPHESPGELSWLRKLRQWEDALADPRRFTEEIKEDLLQDEIYVFTPRGDVMRLAVGATPVDFAYHVHTDVGHACVGARVNGRIVPLKYQLRNCDIVEIRTARNARPRGAWLRFVRTSRAKSKIRAWLRTNLDTEKLLSEVERRQPKPGTQETAKPTGPDAVRSTPDGRKPVVTLDGDSNILFDFAKCCHPEPGDPIIGYLSRGRGVIIHRQGCPNMRHLIREPERIVYPGWRVREEKQRGRITLLVTEDRYLTAEIIALVSAHNTGIYSVQTRSVEHGRSRIDLELEYSGPDEWQLLADDLARFPGIESLADDGRDAQKGS